MNKSSCWYQWIFEAFEHSWVFNLNQIVLDPGKTRQIQRFLNGVPYRSTIDIGCGTGNWAKFGRDQYLGIDSSPSFIAACRRRYHGDSAKSFIEADAGSLILTQRYDLTILISVLHHLADDEALRLTAWVARNTRYFFIFDLYPVRWNPLSRLLYALDRGNYIREPSVQKQLILREPHLQLVKEDSYYSPNGLYRHSLFLFESSASQGN